MKRLEPPEVLVGARVRLRRSVPGDAEGVFRAADDPEVMRFMDWPAHESVGDAREHLDGSAARWDAGTEHHWVIESREDLSILGCIACSVDGAQVDFGYFLARPAWGRGLGTEAVGLLWTWLLDQPSVLRITATTDLENVRSARLLERAGLVRERVLPAATHRPNIGGQPRDTAVYAWAR